MKKYRKFKKLLKEGTLVLTDKFCPCDIRAYSIETVITTEELWKEHKADVVPNCSTKFDLILL